MSSSSEDTESPLESIARPLRYAARNDYQNLGVLKSLEASLKEALARTRSRVPASSREARAVVAIAPLVEGLDRSGAAARIERVRRILEVIDGLEGLAVQRGNGALTGTGGENGSTPRNRSPGENASAPRNRSPGENASAPLNRSGGENASAPRNRSGGENASAPRNRSPGENASAPRNRNGGENASAPRNRSRRENASAPRNRSGGENASAPRNRGPGENPSTLRNRSPGENASASGRAQAGDPANGSRAEPQKKRPRARVPASDALPATPLASLAGIGPKTAERLASKGLVTVQDALLFLPRRYEDRSAFQPIASLSPGAYASVRGEVLAFATRFRGPGRRVFELAIGDGTSVLSCRFFRFNASAMEKRFQRGQRVIVSGTVTEWGARRQMVHPDVEPLTEGEDGAPQGLIPVYGEIEGVPAKTLRKILVELALGAAKRIDDPLPATMRARLELAELGPAILCAHHPSSEPGLATQSPRATAPGSGAAAADPSASGLPDAAADPSASGLPDAAIRSLTSRLRRRLVFDELFFFQLALALRRQGEDEVPGLTNASPEPWPKIAASMLPFSLTGAQRRALDEIARDLAAQRPMNRLLQGDVGSGKTAVAMVAAAIVAAAGRQTALLAPTEILAEQHYKSASRLLAPRGLRVRLLTGSTRAPDRREILADLARGEVDLCVGTHALIEPDVQFRALGLAIVDEQHRFGVEQRAALSAKSEPAKPDVLVMTATPIPRTLALTVYGDLRVTLLDELPPGRSPVATKLFAAGGRDEVHRRVHAEIEKGRQAYVVFPLVDASEKIDLTAATEAFEELKERFRPHRVGLLHGRMPAEEKSRSMEAFVRGEIAVLVSTTVVEVGVDVANATVMVIEHAERFGLSQLHQLRGRVGRGHDPGQCLLVAGGAGEEGSARLAILESSSDGFWIAEQDLILRGPGELLGTRQAGLPDLVLADLARDARALELARSEAFRTVEADPHLLHAENAAIAIELNRRFAGRLGLLGVG